MLDRDPEPGLGAVETDPVDYCLSVALSPEREALLRQRGDVRTKGLAISTSPYGGHWVTDLSDKVIGHSLRMNGVFAEHDIAMVTLFLSRLGRWHPGKTFLDIGSNIGTHTIFALHNGFANAICLEPDQRNFRLLQVNQLLNGVSDRCRNFNIAASNAEGTVDFELSPDNYGNHRIREPGHSGYVAELYAEHSRLTVAVKTTLVSKFLGELGISDADIGLVWIDTQGHEGHVLEGCTPLLAAGVPVVAEFWPYGLKRSNGYAMLRDALQSNKRVFDIRATDDSALPLELKLSDLDLLHHTLLQQESAEFAAHTDLLIL